MPKALKKFLFFLSLAALWLHSLLPFFALYQIPATPSLFGEKVLLCTAEGFRFVNWNDLQSGKIHPKPHKLYQCPLCYASAKGKGVTPYVVDITLASFRFAREIAYDTGAEAGVSAERLWQKLRTRSPPFSFIA